MDNIIKLYHDVSALDRDVILEKFSNMLKDRTKGKDMDVVTYVSHLFFAVALQEFYEMADPYVFTDPSDLVGAVKGTEDKTLRYFIFKVNADRQFLHLLFDEDLSPLATRRRKEMACLYFDQAALYNNRVYQKATSVSDVLHKISANIDHFCKTFRGLLSQRNAVIEKYVDLKFKEAFQDIQRIQTLDEILDDFNQGRITLDEMKDRAGKKVV